MHLVTLKASPLSLSLPNHLVTPQPLFTAALAKPDTLSVQELCEGMRSLVATLHDLVEDAPKAPGPIAKLMAIFVAGLSLSLTRGKPSHASLAG